MTIDFKVGGGSQSLTPQDDQAELEKAENLELQDQRAGERLLEAGARCPCPCHYAIADPIEDSKKPHDRACCSIPSRHL